MLYGQWQHGGRRWSADVVEGVADEQKTGDSFLGP